jgi:hypothetical protein
MNNPDLDIILRTLAEVRRTMNESGPRDTMRTIDQLRDVLDRPEFVRALDRMNRRRMLRVVDD